MAETGTLSDKSVATLVRDMGRNRRSGVLRLSHGRTIRVLIFDEGRPAFALSNVPEEQLDVLLVRQRRLRPDQAAEAKSQIKKEFELGSKLVELGMLEPDDLRAATIEQARNVIAAAFSLYEGEFTLDTAARAPFEISIGVATGRLVMESARDASIDAARIVLEGAGRLIATSDSPLEGANLSSVDGYLLSRLTSPMTADEICNSSGLPEEQVLPTLYALFAAGFLERVDDDAPVDAEPEAETFAEVPVAELRADLVRRLASFESADHYEVLGIPRSGDLGDVKNAYYALAKQYHPDRHRHASDPDIHDKLEAIFARISRAYEILKDGRLRTDYDARLGPPKVPPPISQAPPPQAPPPRPAAPPATTQPPRPLVPPVTPIAQPAPPRPPSGPAAAAPRPTSSAMPTVERPPSGPTSPAPRPPSSSMPATPRPPSSSMPATPRPSSGPMPTAPRPNSGSMAASERPATGPLSAQPPASGPAPFDIATGVSEPQSVQLDDAQRAEQMYREGVRRFEHKDLMGAIHLWRDAVRLAPENGEYNKRLGLALSRNPRWHKEAETHLLAAMKKEALNPELTNALGNVYLSSGLKKRAEAQFKKVLAYSPSNRDAMKGLQALGIEYESILRTKKSPTTATKGKSATGGDEKQGMDAKTIGLVVVGALILLYVVLWISGTI
jgi:tetratricopeptide (TPR) repeat protein